MPQVMGYRQVGIFRIEVAGVAAVPSVSNMASVTGAETDPNPANNSATAMTTVNPIVNLSVTKADSPDPVIINTNLTYTITVSNSGPSAATGVTVTDTLPSGPTFVSAMASQGSCTGTTTVICNLGTVNNGASATVTIVIRPAVAATLMNSVSVTANETDSNPANNSATATTTASTMTFDITTPSGAPTSATILTGGTVTFDATVNCLATGQLIALLATTTAPATVINITPPAVICNSTGPQNITVTVVTTSCVWLPPAPRPNFPNPPIPMVGPWMMLLLLLLTWWLSQRRKQAHVPAWQRALAGVALFVSPAGLTACAGNSARRGGAFGTPAGTYAVTVNATASGVTRSLNFTLNVTLPWRGHWPGGTAAAAGAGTRRRAKKFRAKAACSPSASTATACTT